MNKKTLLCAFSGLCALLLLANCGGDSESDGPTLSVSPIAVTLEADGTGQTISVTSNTSWTVRADDSWLTCSPSGGSGGASITIRASVNTGETRYSKLTFTDKTGRATAEVRVTQKAGTAPPTPTLSVSKSSVSISATGGNDSFTITSNTSWTVSSDQTWCTVSPTSGSNDGTVTIKADENKNTTTRSATITVKYGDKSETVTVNQSAADIVLKVSSTSLSFAENGGSENISITCNSDWTVSSNQSWCTVSPASGSNDGTVTVTVSANDSNSERSASITIKSGNVTQEVSILQAAKPEDGIGRDDYGEDTNLDKNK